MPSTSRRFPRSASGSSQDTLGQGSTAISIVRTRSCSRSRSTDPGSRLSIVTCGAVLGQVMSMSRCRRIGILFRHSCTAAVLRRHSQTNQTRRSCLAICSRPSSAWLCNAALDQRGFVSSGMGLLWSSKPLPGTAMSLGGRSTRPNIV